MANLTAGELTLRLRTITVLANPQKMSEIVPPILTWQNNDHILCRTETLSVLLDYRSEDNKEGTFEVGFAISISKVDWNHQDLIR